MLTISSPLTIPRKITGEIPIKDCIEIEALSTESFVI